MAKKKEENVATEVTNNEIVENQEEQKVETPEVEKQLIVKESFRDKYKSIVVFNENDIIIASDEIQGTDIIELEKGKYQVSLERYEELKQTSYVK